jgi:hypothetical protein
MVAMARERTSGEVAELRRITGELIKIKLDRAAKGLMNYTQADAAAEIERLERKLKMKPETAGGS